MDSHSQPDYEFPGEHCQRVGLTKRQLLDFLSNDVNAHLPEVTLTNAFVLELASFKEEKKLSWSSVARWCTSMCGISDGKLNEESIRLKVQRLKKAKTKLFKSASRPEHQERLSLFLAEPFALQKIGVISEEHSEASKTCTVQEVNAKSRRSSDEIIQHLKEELINVESELVNERDKSSLLERRIEQWRNRLRNIRKKLARREQKIVEQNQSIHSSSTETRCSSCHDQEELQCELEKLADTVEELKGKCSKEQKRVFYHKKKAQTLSEMAEDREGDFKDLRSQLREQGEELKLANEKIEVQQAVIDDLSATAQELITKIDGKYTDEVRQCCFDLLSMNVGVWNVRPVMKSVLALAGKQVEDLPSIGLLSKMFVELKAVSSVHICQEVLDEQVSDHTLHSDGTTKFGRKFQSYQVATSKQTFSVGLIDMKSGTAEHTFDMFKQSLQDIEELGSKLDHENASKKILSKITNTMSDRSIVQKNFNTMLHDWRSEILPDITEGWSDLTDEEKTKLRAMNNFFCGLHFIVGLAEHASSALNEWEKLHFEEHGKVGAVALPGAWERDEAGTARFVRTATKAFQKHGDEQAGCIGDFHAFLAEQNIPCPLANFKGNRYYVLFFNGAGIYFLHECMSHFLQNVHGTTNRLLKAVKADLDVPEFVAGARALGLLSKLVICPLWRTLENKNISVLDMSKVYTQLVDNFKSWSADASPLIDGGSSPFSGAHIDWSCKILQKLLEPSTSDSLTVEILQAVCTVLATFSARILSDHLPGGAFYQPSDTSSASVSSVAKTNAVSERDFAQLDRLMREKPNAATIALEGMVLFANNCTGAWMNSKTAEERHAIIALARKCADGLRKKYQERRSAILKHRAAELRRKEEELAAKRAKELQRKEQLTNDIARDGGLWTSAAMVNEKVAGLPSINSRRAALRLQLFFRKFVLQQPALKHLFQLSKDGKLLSVEALSNNLCTLVADSAPSLPPQDIPTSSSVCDEPAPKRPALDPSPSGEPSLRHGTDAPANIQI